MSTQNLYLHSSNTPLQKAQGAVAQSAVDVLVVGGGHAGAEAAHAASRMGASVLLLTHQKASIARMSCNPAMGGIGKTHLMREVDAMGGLMALASDLSSIHVRTLNASKGPAVQAVRAQCDTEHYPATIQKLLSKCNGLTVIEDAVSALWCEGGVLKGVFSESGRRYSAAKVIITGGTFLRGVLHYGSESHSGGREGEPASATLSESLTALGIPSFRLKTGTPARLHKDSLDYTQFTPQEGDDPLRVKLSFWPRKATPLLQLPCHITRTNPSTHQIISKNLQKSAIYSGKINSAGPRYCPSIEDKIVRFSDKDSHYIFVEPEGLNTPLVYPNGISTSLPPDVQDSFIRSIKGFEKAEVVRYGYAVEYDCFDPRHLERTLESKALSGLYLAGQVNGTTGYEEAAAQGLLAGVNAVLALRFESSWVPLRSESYLGVLVDDLVRFGVTEPYRMFTSRAEHRLYLRQDNADARLFEKAKSLGLLSERKIMLFQAKQESAAVLREMLMQKVVHAGEPLAETLAKEGVSIHDHDSFLTLLRRPSVTASMLAPHLPSGFGDSAWLDVEINIKYEGYIQRQMKEVANFESDETLPLSAIQDYAIIASLSHEMVTRLNAARPASLGEARRVPNITPAAIEMLRIYVRTLEKTKKGMPSEN